MATRERSFNIPQKTLDVSRARYHLTRLLRRLRVAPKVYLITQSGKPAGALVNVDWLEKLRAQAQGKGPGSLFGQAVAARDWEETLTRLRQTLTPRTLSRLASKGH